MEAEKATETLNNDFAILTEKNRQKVLEMTKFLVITQNNIVPTILNENEKEN